MKFLVVRFSSIGDIVLTTPVVRCLKKQVPGAVIHYLTKKTFGSILEPNPYIDQLHFLKDDLSALIKQLQAEKFDALIDLHNNMRTIRVKRSLNIQSFSFEKLNIEKWLMTNFKWNRLPDKHVVDRYMETVSSIGVKNDGGGLDYFIPAEQQIKMESLPEKFRNGYIGLVTGAAHATKRIPVEKMKEICFSVDLPIVLLGGKEDSETGELLAAADPTRIYNGCGKFSLHQSASLVSQSRLIVTPDTGLMHIAAALKKPVIAVWGNTVPDFGMYPYYGDNVVPYTNMEVPGLRCRPCSKIGYAVCPKKHFSCMLQQEVQAIATLIRTYWQV
jgi:ADP-heptose:LPS heptosyltransferase